MNSSTGNFQGFPLDFETIYFLEQFLMGACK